MKILIIHGTLACSKTSLNITRKNYLIYLYQCMFKNPFPDSVAWSEKYICITAFISFKVDMNTKLERKNLGVHVLDCIKNLMKIYILLKRIFYVIFYKRKVATICEISYAA